MFFQEDLNTDSVGSDLKKCLFMVQWNIVKLFQNIQNVNDRL